MGNLIRILRDTLSGRPRRYWRYVSPGRHGLGMLLLALVLTATYGYWYFTNDARIRRTAERYLSHTTGWKVTIRRAQFSLFGGLHLHGVRMYLPGSKTDYPFLEAEKVQMSHSPWRLLAGGEVKPTEIICMAPVVTFESEQLAYKGGARGLLIGGQDSAVGRVWPEVLFPIRLREGRLQVVQTSADGGPGGEPKSIPLNMSLLPQGHESYRILFEDLSQDQQLVRQGSVVINLRTGAFIGDAEGYIPPLPSLQAMLPAEYHKWLQSYSVSGNYVARASGGGKDNLFEVQLKDLAMRLPDDQGGFRLEKVSGKIIFREDRIQLDGLAGQLQQAPGARLRMSGEYNGYEQTSPYHIELKIDDLDLPTPFPIAGEVGKAMERLLGDYQPKGRVSLGFQLSRTGKDRIDIRGSAQPQGMSILYKHFPYPVSDVRGRISFFNNQAELEEVRARHGPAEITLAGKMEWVKGKQTYDIHIAGKNVPLDQALAQAVPKSFRFVWDTIRPGGQTNVKVRVRRGVNDTQDIIDLDLMPDGHATMRHAVFPYPVENIAGLVRIADNVATIEGVTGGRGPMRFTINGLIRDVHRKDCDVAVDIDIRDMPLDQTLQEALAGTVRQTVQSMHPTSGKAESALVKLRQSPGKPMTYDISARLKDLGICCDSFPYPLTDMTGELKVETDVFRLTNLVGRHAQAEITADVKAQAFGDKLGLELEAFAREVPLDKVLYAAIPPGARRVWDQLAPAGKSNVHLKLRTDMPGQKPGDIDYCLVMHPQGMRVIYSEFPYPFGNIRGEVVITPGRTELKGMTAGEGDLAVWLDGLVLSGVERDQIDLSVRAQNIPIDAALRQALPSEVAGVIKYFRNGGLCDVDLPKLSLTHLAPATQPATQPAAGAPGEAAAKPPPAAPAQPASAPATQPARPAPAWSVENGTITVRKAILDAGGQPRELSGKISGSAARRPEGLELSAELAVDNLSLLDRRLENIRGKLTKSARSPLLRIDNLLAYAHGGRMAGFAEVLFVDPLQYGLSLYVEDMPLAQLVPSGPDKSGKSSPPEGLVSGNIQMTGSANEPNQALGTLRLSKARLYKLPVLLGMLNVVYLSLPGDTAFTDGHLTYRLRDNALVFDEIYLTGPALSMVGSGSMDMKSRRMRLTFLTGPPGKMPRLRSLADELVKLISKELMEIEITGTIDRPITRTVPLRGVDSFIRRIMQPEGRN